MTVVRLKDALRGWDHEPGRFVVGGPHIGLADIVGVAVPVSNFHPGRVAGGSCCVLLPATLLLLP